MSPRCGGPGCRGGVLRRSLGESDRVAWRVQRSREQPAPLTSSGRRGGRREAYVPTQCPSPCSQARIPSPHEHPVGARHLEGPPRQGSRPPVGLIWRIRERDAFARLGREGARIRTSSLWCTYVIDPAATPPRLAFAIGRQVGPAVTRNRVRRRLRALLTAGPELPSGWYLIGARPSVNELTFDQLGRELTTLCSKITPVRPG